MSSFQQIPNMNPALSLTGTEMLEAVQQGGTVRVTVLQIGQYVVANFPTLGVSLGNYANDAAAAVHGVSVGGLYRNGSVVMVRVA